MPSDGSLPNASDNSNNTTSILIGVVAGVIFVIALIVLTVAVGCCKRKKDAEYNKHTHNNKYGSEDDKMRHPLNHPVSPDNQEARSIL